MYSSSSTTSIQRGQLAQLRTVPVPVWKSIPEQQVEVTFIPNKNVSPPQNHVNAQGQLIKKKVPPPVAPRRFKPFSTPIPLPTSRPLPVPKPSSHTDEPHNRDHKNNTCITSKPLQPTHVRFNQIQRVEQHQVRAMWDCYADQLGDLEFKKGDVITVLKKNDSGWWIGKINDRTGPFPANYVTPL